MWFSLELAPPTAGSSLWLPVHKQIHLAEFPHERSLYASNPGLFLLGRSGVSAPFSPDCQSSYPGSVLPLLSSGHGPGPGVYGAL